jgi:acetoin:2,6-dichlorophenolindophenol oxidoreductase subunit beta
MATIEAATTVTRTVPAATRDAIRDEMARDEAVVCWGEDIKGGSGGDALSETEDAWPGVMPAYEGLAAEFGANRVRDMPIAEAGFIGAAFGAAALGLRPIVDLMFVDFLGVCLDQIANSGARNPYMFGNQIKAPVVILTAFGAGRRMGGQHSGIHYSVFAHYPGLKVVAPSTPYDAKGLMTAAIRDDNPVVFCNHRMLATFKAEVPDTPYVIPIGKADLKRKGDDVVLVAVSRMVHVALEAAEELARSGVAAAVLDLRSLSPLDEEAILEALRRCGRMVIVDEDHPRCSVAADVAALAASGGYGFLRAPVERVTSPHAPVPFSPPLEDAYLPSAERVVAAARRVLNH